jgi:hypothetical protein
LKTSRQWGQKVLGIKRLRGSLRTFAGKGKKVYNPMIVSIFTINVAVESLIL